MKYICLLLLPMSLWSQIGGSPGSLFTPTGRLADAARDLRASQLDDIVTIVVSESLAAVASGVSNTARKSSASSNVAALAGAVAAASRLANPLNISGDQQLQAQGQTSRNMTLTTTLSARVVDITPNGTLVIEGTRDIGVNSEKQSITVRGLVRPADLSTANSVRSTQIANLQVHVTGKGIVGDAIRRPHYLYRLLLGLLPF